MTNNEIETAASRATEIMDGFRQPTTRQARDVLRLIKHARMLQSELHQIERQQIADDHKRGPSMPPGFESLFGKRY